MNWRLSAAKNLKESYKMKEESGIIYTTPKIPVTAQVRYCSDCRFYLQTASKDPCNTCMANTKGEKWEPAK